MQITELRPDATARVNAGGNGMMVDVRLLANPQVGDFVLVHAGCAIEKVDGEAAADLLTLLEEVAAYERS